jgi:hypothetical protein
MEKRLTTPVIIIVYTTLYRKGGQQFPVVAQTLAREKRESGFAGELRCVAVESKRELLKIFAETKAAGQQINEFHFVGHAGMYGPMFGTVAFPNNSAPTNGKRWIFRLLKALPPTFIAAARPAGLRHFLPALFRSRRMAFSGTRPFPAAKRITATPGLTRERSGCIRLVARGASRTGGALRS